MGIDNLVSVIKTHAPESIIDKHLSALRGFRLAVDISVFLYKFARTAGEAGWINLFITFLSKFIKYDIVTVCVFDGPNFPVEKRQEQQIRREQTKKILAKHDECVELRNLIQDEYLDCSFDENSPAKPLPNGLINQAKKLLSSTRKKDLTNYFDPDDIVSSLNEKIEKLRNQTVEISSNIKTHAFQIVEMLGLHAIQADGEAEGLCSYLAKKGMVNGVLTEDTDCLVYGTPFMFAYREYKMSDEKVVVIHLDTVLDSMAITHSEFIDMCILLKCDYNRLKITETNELKPMSVLGVMPDINGNVQPSQKTVAMGKVKIYELVTRYGGWESIKKYIVNQTDIKYERCREIFTETPDLPFHEMFSKNSGADLEKLQKFATDNGIWIDFSKLYGVIQDTKITFESGSDDSDEELEKILNEQISQIDT